MDVRDEAIRYCRKIETWLYKRLGATGNGLLSKVNSVKPYLDPAFVKLVREIAPTRNPLVHDDDFRIKDPQRFLEKCRRAYDLLRTTSTSLRPVSTRAHTHAEGLRTCRACGHRVAAEREECVRCGHRIRIDCGVCGRSYQDGEPGAPIETFACCGGCYHRHFADAEDAPCRTCGCVVGPKPRGSGAFCRESLVVGAPAACPNCGATNPLSVAKYCDECGGPIIPAVHKETAYDGRTLHDFCFEIRYGEKLRQEQDRKEKAADAERLAEAQRLALEERKTVLRTTTWGLINGAVLGGFSWLLGAIPESQINNDHFIPMCSAAGAVLVLIIFAVIGGPAAGCATALFAMMALPATMFLTVSIRYKVQRELLSAGLPPDLFGVIVFAALCLCGLSIGYVVGQARTSP